ISAPTIAVHSDLRRARKPPPRRATTGAAMRAATLPAARNPGCRSPSPAEPASLVARRDDASPLMPLPSSAASRSRHPAPAALLAWYDRPRRELPWRARPGERPDPYRVWLSEIMLQQTTVPTVAPYFDRFVAQWPDIHALAGASLDEVLHQWQG